MDLNKVMIIGRATTDLDVKKMGESGVSVVNFSVATNRRYKNSEGNTIEEAEFHRCVAFAGIADTLGKYLEKGKRIYIEGRIRTRKWEDTNGNTRYTTEIVVENFIFLDSAGNKTSQGQSSEVDKQEDEDLPF
ncbi:single-stranded DNA-binding protein [Candidatus Absconditicoccus praedator]|uniref:single-stranded DNA-binding protein n=1 Tax=Candidatus Absconditicoccus praedator TaxID=2735562 RepID=UPI001E4262BC|nr:single-stranded DNA-binding protein [Candidatus Absconditicoccus praedator]UFX82820.1 single-stranded DNA-binding protein [Candidatus Absconditicoccus praedator]